ncbi:MAG: phosphotransferase [Fimbriimonadaceae bacterium]|nr:phosphotransferase [Alphaproteobacteria bacterium]
MTEDQFSHQIPQRSLTDLANASLCLWDIPEGARARLINISENATYLVEGPGDYRAVLRVHRENYHSRTAISCELAWSRALHEEADVITPAYFPGKDGQAIQTVQCADVPGPRHMVLFEFVEGTEPDPDADLAAPFEELGEIAARTHNHSIGWQKPANFERLVWNTQTVFGARPTWGDWRDGPNIGADERKILQRLETFITDRLDAFGQSPDRYGLIHADMRLANLLIHNGSTRLIDFDDCGLGWFLYDFAAAISFMEDHPQVPALKQAWLAGYRKARSLRAEDEAEMDTFVMLRRMALLAWIGSHSEVAFARQLAPDFAGNTVTLAESYLSSFT